LTVALGSSLELHPQVALRPEPFGALAYHYGNRRLIFLKHPDVVRVVRSLDEHASLAETLDACGIAPARWPSFLTAMRSLEASEVLREPPMAGPSVAGPG
jgi:putative mycofactocin binding protein MftB